MGMVADVILAIAEVTIALGAITKLQLRIRNICSATKDTFVGVGRLRFLFCVDLYINGLGAAAPVPQTGKGEMHPTPRWNAPHFKANAPHPRSFYQTCALFPKSTNLDRGLSIFTFYLFTLHFSLFFFVDFGK